MKGVNHNPQASGAKKGTSREILGALSGCPPEAAVAAPSPELARFAPRVPRGAGESTAVPPAAHAGVRSGASEAPRPLWQPIARSLAPIARCLAPRRGAVRRQRVEGRARAAGGGAAVSITPLPLRPVKVAQAVRHGRRCPVAVESPSRPGASPPGTLCRTVAPQSERPARGCPGAGLLTSRGSAFTSSRRSVRPEAAEPQVRPELRERPPPLAQRRRPRAP